MASMPGKHAANACINAVKLCNRPPYPFVENEPRRVARDAYVAWQGSRYSVPWQ